MAQARDAFGNGISPGPQSQPLDSDELSLNRKNVKRASTSSGTMTTEQLSDDDTVSSHPLHDWVSSTSTHYDTELPSSAYNGEKNNIEASKQALLKEIQELRKTTDPYPKLMVLRPLLLQSYTLLTSDRDQINNLAKLNQNELVSYFLRSALPYAVRIIMACSWSATAARNVQTFLQDVVVLCIELFTLDIHELHLALSHILGSQKTDPGTNQLARTFYQNYAAGIPSIDGQSSGKHTALSHANSTLEEYAPAIPRKMLPTNHFVYSCGQSSTFSLLLLQNIELFGAHGGFDILIQRVLQGVGSHGVEHVLLPLTLIHILHCCVAMCMAIETSFWGSYCIRFRSVVFDYFLNLSDENLKALTKRLFVKALSQLEQMFAATNGPIDIRESIEKFELSFALRQLRCPFLDKRIHGINVIKDYVDACSRRDFTKSNRASSVLETQSTSKIVRITSTYLSEWLNKSGVIELIFEPDSVHIELIKRSVYILMFLESCNLLTEAHIDMLWRLSGLGKHETIEHVVYEIIGQLVTYLPDSLLKHIMHIISERNVADFNQELVALVQIVSLRLMETTSLKGDAFKGLDVLWRILLHRPAVSYRVDAPLLKSTASVQRTVQLHIDVVDKATDAFLELLSHEAAVSQRTQFIDACISGIKSDDDPSNLLALLGKIIQKYPVTKGWFFSGSSITQSTAIEHLNSKHAILELLISEIRRFKQACAELHQENVLNSSGSEYASAIQIRQQLLIFIVSSSQLRISIQQLDQLWEMFVTQSYSVSERDGFFYWLINASEMNGTQSNLADDVKEHIYVKKINELDPCTLSHSGFSLVYKYLVVSELKRGALKIDETAAIRKQHWLQRANEKLAGTRKSTMIYQDHIIAPDSPPTEGDEEDVEHAISSKERIGISENDKWVGCELIVINLSLLRSLNFLWAIAMSSVRPVVGRQAILLLNALNSNLSPRLKQQAVSIHKQHLDLCLKHLSTALTSEKSIDSQRVVRRCVFLLRSFIATIRGHSVVKKILFRIVPGKEFRCHPFDLDLEERSTVGDIRRSVLHHLSAVKYGLHLNQIAITWNGTLLLEDSISVSQFDFRPSDEICVSRVTEPIRSFVHPKEDRELYTSLSTSYPYVCALNANIKLDASAVDQDRADSSIFFNVDSSMNFAQFFGPLDAGGTQAADAWEVLSLLPINSNYEQTVLKLVESSQGDWNKVLDSENIFRLLYSVRILQHQVRLKKMSIASESAIHWVDRFVAKGGALYVARLLLNARFYPYDSDRFASRTIYNESVERFVWLICDLLSMQDSLQDMASFEAITTQLIADVLLPIIMATSHAPSALEDGTNILISTFLRFMVQITKLAPTVLSAISNFNRLDNVLFVCLVQNSQESARNLAARHLRQLSLAFARQGDATIFRRLFSLLHSPLLQECSQNIREYFALLSSCLDDIHQYANTFSEFLVDLKHMGVFVFHLLQASASHETYDLYSEPDMYIVGLLEVLRKFVHYGIICDDSDLDGILNYAFHQTLFDTPVQRAEGCKCKTILSRNAGYALIIEICKMKHKFTSSVIDLLLSDSLWMKERSDTWLYEPALLERGPDQQVGLVNQGATCYMNSFLQQLFMVPVFRAGILSVNLDGITAQSSSNPSNDMPKDNRSSAPPARFVLQQLQLMFAHLQLSHKQYFDTLPFCKILRDWNGQPINLNEQHDVNEFAMQLFEILESELKNTSQQTILDETFHGVIMHQTISKECEHTAEREEPFYIIPLNVKNKRTLAQSFDLYVAGDLLDANNKYLCGKCNTKVQALRRECLFELPNHLIIHLKRFEYDFDSMQKRKINDRFEFPMELDVEPYTREGLYRREHEGDGVRIANLGALASRPEPGFYDYQLTGILVHTGQADAGHYYSFIKNSDTQNWFEFNDTQVRPFDPKNIPAQCFGGTEIQTVIDETTKIETKQEVELVNNAYLLVYTRVYKNMKLSSTKSSLVSSQTSREPDEGAAFWRLGFGTPSSSILPVSAVSPFMHPVSSNAEMNESVANATSESPAPEASKLGYSRSSSRPLLDQGSPVYKLFAPPTLTTSPIDISTPSAIDGDVESNNLSLSSDSSWMLGGNDNSVIPKDILTTIWTENVQFLTDKNVFDFAFYSFVWNVCNLPGSNFEGLQYAQLVTGFIFKVLVRAVDNASFPQWLHLLYKVFITPSHSNSRVWLIDHLTHSDLLSMMLFACPAEEIRKGFADFMVSLYNASTASNSSSNVDASTLLSLLLPFLNNIRQQWRVYNEFWGLLYNLASVSIKEREWFLRKGLLNRVIAFYIDAKPLLNFNIRQTRARGPTRRIHPPNSTEALKLMALLVTSCTTDTLTTAIDNTTSLLPIESLDRKLMLTSIYYPEEERSLRVSFFSWLVLDKTNTRAALKIICHWCHANEEISNRILDMCIRGIINDLFMPENMTDSYHFLRIANALLAQKDDLAIKKAEHFLPQLFNAVDKINSRLKTNDERFLMNTNKFLLLAAHQQHAVFHWLQKHRNWNNWLDMYKLARHQDSILSQPVRPVYKM